MSVVNDTKNSEMPSKDNVEKWRVIGQNSINSVMDSSRVFFKKLSEFLV